MRLSIFRSETRRTIRIPTVAMPHLSKVSARIIACAPQFELEDAEYHPRIMHVARQDRHPLRGVPSRIHAALEHRRHMVAGLHVPHDGHDVHERRIVHGAEHIDERRRERARRRPTTAAVAQWFCEPGATFCVSISPRRLGCHAVVDRRTLDVGHQLGGHAITGAQKWHLARRVQHEPYAAKRWQMHLARRRRLAVRRRHRIDHRLRTVEECVTAHRRLCAWRPARLSGRRRRAKRDGEQRSAVQQKSQNVHVGR